MAHSDTPAPPRNVRAVALAATSTIWFLVIFQAFAAAAAATIRGSTGEESLILGLSQPLNAIADEGGNAKMTAAPDSPRAAAEPAHRVGLRVTSGSHHCTITDDQCVTSRIADISGGSDSGSGGGGEKGATTCSVEVLMEGTLTATTELSAGPGHGTMTIDGAAFNPSTGTAGPSHVKVAAGATITWTHNGTEMAPGPSWSVCWSRAPRSQSVPAGLRPPLIEKEGLSFEEPVFESRDRRQLEGSGTGVGPGDDAPTADCSAVDSMMCHSTDGCVEDWTDTSCWAQAQACGDLWDETECGASPLGCEYLDDYGFFGICNEIGAPLPVSTDVVPCSCRAQVCGDL